MLINNLNPNTKLFIFEINPLLYKALHDKFYCFKNIYIINTSAEKVYLNFPPANVYALVKKLNENFIVDSI